MELPKVTICPSQEANNNHLTNSFPADPFVLDLAGRRPSGFYTALNYIVFMEASGSANSGSIASFWLIEEGEKEWLSGRGVVRNCTDVVVVQERPQWCS